MATLAIGVSGLNAAQAGILTTEHNISNVNTAGYRRQAVSFTASSAQFSGGNLFGAGVNIDAVRHQYSQFLDSEVLLDQTRLSRQETYSSNAAQVDQLLSDNNSGLSTAVSSFFNAADEVSNDPTSNAARQVLLASARNLAGRVNGLSQSLTQMRDQSNSDLSSMVGQINTYSSKIADINQSIARVESSGGQQANDLRDQRDQVVAELNKLVDVTPIQEPNGNFDLFIGGTQPLVMGNRAYTMTTVADSTDPSLKVPAMQVSGGGVALASSAITGGQIAGLLGQRTDVLMPALAGLNRIAASIASEVNRVQRGGLDQNLAAGTDMFTSVVQQTGATSSYIDVGYTANPLANDNYTVSYNGASYTVTPSSGPAIAGVAAGAEVTDASGKGLGFSIAAGTPPPAAGDTWQLNFKDYAGSMSALLSLPDQIAAAASTADGPGDNGNAKVLAALRSAGSLDNGATTYSNAYIQIVSNTAALASEADIGRQAYDSLVTQATSAQQSVSGVNLDEEAVNLIRFQQAYQAAARAITVANGLFDSVLGIAQ
jgi:flagellar hook-associated protein 1 FlgK